MTSSSNSLSFFEEEIRNVSSTFSPSVVILAACIWIAFSRKIFEILISRPGLSRVSIVILLR